MCATVIEEGEPCGVPNVLCAPTGLVCQGGICVATDEKKIFDAQCPDSD